MLTRRHLLIPWLALLGGLLSGCASAPAAPEVRAALAPSGMLRVGMYIGSPTSVVADPAKGPARGVGHDLGQALAARLGVPFEPVVFSKNADVLNAVKTGKVDLSFTNATAARARDMDFSPGVLGVEKGYLVPRSSKATNADDLERDSARIGITAGSTTERELAGVFKRASLVPVDTLKHAAEMLEAGQLAAFASNKAILFEMSDTLPGSRVLAVRWGLENFALAVPKGREAGAAFLKQFVAAIKADGTAAKAVERAGLRGTTASGAN
jgi:polar amino acid transport system substrate-binding protein